MDLDLAGYSLDSLRLSVGGIRLGLSKGSYVSGGPDQPTASIMIERDFDVEDTGVRATLRIDDRAELWRLRPLLGQEVVSARASNDGHLTVEFPGRQIRIAGLDRYEAWSVSWLDGRLVVSTPGGDVTTWTAREH